MQLPLLNMCNMLELQGFFVCLGGLIKFFNAWGGVGGGGGQKILLGCGLPGEDQYPGSHYELNMN